VHHRLRRVALRGLIQEASFVRVASAEESAGSISSRKRRCRRNWAGAADLKMRLLLDRRGVLAVEDCAEICRQHVSAVGPFEPAVRVLLAEFPDMPTSVVAERIWWARSAEDERHRSDTGRQHLH
jgi:hypothetical protein